MARLYVEPPRGNADNAIDNWVQNHTEWTGDPVSHALEQTTTGIDDDGTEYLRGDYRFIQSEPADELLGDLEDRLATFQGGLWYRVGYHECEHDERDPNPCEWEEVRESSGVPEAIPQIK